MILRDRGLRDWIAPILLMAILGVASLCCRSTLSNPQPEVVSIIPGEEFQLSVGGTAQAEGWRVTFLGVIEDSRCPRGLTCVWAGEVKVRLSLLVEARDPYEVELVSRPGVQEPGVDVEGGWRLVLVRVDPYPTPDETILPTQYRVTLIAQVR